jgi:polyphosphate kinase 2 (PPK2 family)
MDRLNRPEKNWKFSLGDVHERERWDDYQKAYQDTIRQTATDHAPWYVVPADHKWYTRLVVASAIIDTLEKLDPQFPAVSEAQRVELDEARVLLGKERKR